MCNVQRILVVWEYVCVGFLYTTILLTLNIYYIGVCILAFYLFLQIECCMIVFLKIKRYYKFIVKKNNFLSINITQNLEISQKFRTFATEIVCSWDQTRQLGFVSQTGRTLNLNRILTLFKYNLKGLNAKIPVVVFN